MPEALVATLMALLGLYIGFRYGRAQGRCEGIAACIKRQRGEPWDF